MILITIFSDVYGVEADLPAVPDCRQEFVRQNDTAHPDARLPVADRDDSSRTDDSVQTGRTDRPGSVNGKELEIGDYEPHTK